jgi:hypothetical protein
MEKPRDRGPNISPRRAATSGQNDYETEQYALFRSIYPAVPTGAAYYGYTTCWVNRGGGTFEEMGQRPAHVVSGVDMIAAAFVKQPA